MYAAFPEGSSPRLAALTFGAEYDASVLVLAYAAACGQYEHADADWPAPGAGTAVAWNPTRTELLVPVYAFAGYVYYASSASFQLVAHPTQGGYFADDEIAGFLEPIADYGHLGFGTDPGYRPSPPLAQGACCHGTHCQVTWRAVCEIQGDIYLGDDVPCEPANPCLPVPARERSWGRVKSLYR